MIADQGLEVEALHYRQGCMDFRRVIRKVRVG